MGKSADIDSDGVPYGDVEVGFSTRGQDDEYTRGQFALVLRLATEYGDVRTRL